MDETFVDFIATNHLWEDKEDPKVTLMVVDHPYRDDTPSLQKYFGMHTAPAFV
jgi:hypothetical protein